jgi:hypothetical protein
MWSSHTNRRKSATCASMWPSKQVPGCLRIRVTIAALAQAEQVSGTAPATAVAPPRSCGSGVVDALPARSLTTMHEASLPLQSAPHALSFAWPQRSRSRALRSTRPRSLEEAGGSGGQRRSTFAPAFSYLRTAWGRSTTRRLDIPSRKSTARRSPVPRRSSKGTRVGRAA